MHVGRSELVKPIVLGCLLALGALGCSGSSGGSDGSSDPGSDAAAPQPDGAAPSIDGGTPPSGGVALSVDTAAAPAVIDDEPPPAGTTYLVLTITLKNAGAPRPLSTNPVLFSLETSGKLILQMTGLVDGNVCSGTVSVANGGQTQCEVGFEVPTGQAASTLVYDDRRGDEATAAIPAIVAPPACETVNGWLTEPSETCLGCFESSLGGSGACASPASAYRTMCTSCSSCNEEPGDASGFCSCEASCDTTACKALFATYMSCVESACATACTSP
jgi:hypothetical protein